jgi:hypothetical protein
LTETYDFSDEPHSFYEWDTGDESDRATTLRKIPGRELAKEIKRRKVAATWAPRTAGRRVTAHTLRRVAQLPPEKFRIALYRFPSKYRDVILKLRRKFGLESLWGINAYWGVDGLMSIGGKAQRAPPSAYDYDPAQLEEEYDFFVDTPTDTPADDWYEWEMDEPKSAFIPTERRRGVHPKFKRAIKKMPLRSRKKFLKRFKKMSPGKRKKVILNTVRKR